MYWGCSIVLPFHVIKSDCALLRMAAYWGLSIVLPFHVIKGWLCIAARCCVLRPLYCSPFPCDKRMTGHRCALLCIEAALLFSFSCDYWMINQSGDFVCCCLFFVCLCLPFMCIKAGMGWVVVVTNWHFSRSFHFYFTALTLVVIVQNLVRTQTYTPWLSISPSNFASDHQENRKRVYSNPWRDRRAHVWTPVTP